MASPVPTSADPATSDVLARILTELSEMKLRNQQLEQKVRVEKYSTWYIYPWFWRRAKMLLSPLHQIDDLHGAATLGSPTLPARKPSMGGLSPIQRPLNSQSSLSALLGSSPPPQPLGPSLQSATSSAITSMTQPSASNSQPSPTLAHAHPLPQTNSNTTPSATPELGPQNGSADPPSYYSKHGKSLMRV